MACDRRTFIRWSGALSAGAVLGGAGHAAPARHSAGAHDVAITELRPDLFLVTSDGSNATLRITSDDMLLVDNTVAEAAPGLLQALQRRFGKRPVTVGYNTHWHWQHTGGNDLLRSRGAHLIAHENTRLWLGADFYVDLEQRRYRPRPPEAIPDEGFYEQHLLHFGGETVRSGLMFQAHTDGDIYVQFPERNVIAAGGVVADGVFPDICPSTGGWIGGLVDAQSTLLALADEETLVVPARGAVLRRADLERQHAMLSEIRDRMFAMVKQGMGARDMLEAGVTKGFEAWGDPTRFVESSYPGLWQNPHYFSRGIF